MEYIFLFSIVAPLALLVLNLTGFRAGSSPAADMAFDSPAPAITPAAPQVTRAVEPVTESRPVAAALTSALSRNKRHRRDYFGDYRPADAIVSSAVTEPVLDGAEIYLMPRRDDHADAMVQSGPPAAHARPGGTLVSLPQPLPLAAQRSVAQR